MDSSFFAPSTLPPLPRAGVRFAVPSRFDQAQWLGLGPHEAYDDRRFSPHLGTFSSSVQELHTPYVYPQECGRRADPRWVFLHESYGSTSEVSGDDGEDDDTVGQKRGNNKSSSGGGNASSSGGSKSGSGSSSVLRGIRGMLIVPCACPTRDRDVTGWGWSASPYSLEMLEASKHVHELRSDDKFHVHVDSQSMVS